MTDSQRKQMQWFVQSLLFILQQITNNTEKIHTADLLIKVNIILCSNIA